MKKQLLLIPFILILLFPNTKIFAASGGYSVSTSSVTLNVGESKIITVSGNNALGRLNISCSNPAVASISASRIFIPEFYGNASFTINALASGSATITIVSTDDFSNSDPTPIPGITKTITVKVTKKEEIKNEVPKQEVNKNPVVDNPNNNQGSNSGSNSNTNVVANKNNQNNQKKDTKEKEIDTRSSNNNLKELEIVGVTLEKIDDTNYKATVNNNIEQININGTCEDENATIEGIGNHQINIGHNNIELIVTAQNGNKKTILVDVYRKEFNEYTDLDNLLQNNNLKDIKIKIEKGQNIDSKILTKIKESKKIVNFDYYDTTTKNIYSWIIDGNQLKNIDDKNLNLDVDIYSKIYDSNLNNQDKKDKQIYVVFNHNGIIPDGIKFKIFVGNNFDATDLINIYYIDQENLKLNLEQENLGINNGYIEYDISHCSDYLITLNDSQTNIVETKEKNKKENVFIKYIICFSCGVIVTLLIIYVKKEIEKKNAKDKNIK